MARRINKSLEALAKKSPEQMIFEDYNRIKQVIKVSEEEFSFIPDAFKYILEDEGLMDRFRFVYHAANHFKSVLSCRYEGCPNEGEDKIARYFAKWYPGSNYSPTTGKRTNIDRVIARTHHVYCSEECFENEEIDHHRRNKMNVYGLQEMKFDNGMWSTKKERDDWNNFILKCMGFEGKTRTKPALKKFFDKMELWIPYDNQERKKEEK